MNAQNLDSALYRYMETFLGPLVDANDISQHNELERRDRLHRFFLSIVGSNISSVYRRDAESAIAEMQKRLASSGRNTQSAIRVSQLFSMLKQRDASYDWWPILNLISESSSTTAASVAYAGGTSTSSFFATRAGEMERDRERAMQMAENAMVVDEPQSAYSVSQQQQQPAGGSDETLYRMLPTYDAADEMALLRDLIYVMQGIDGTCVRWNEKTKMYGICGDMQFSRPTREMVLSIAELGALARNVQQYVMWVENSGRLFEQSFGSELRQELAAYFELVAGIEAKLANIPAELRPGETLAGASLRRVLGWTSDVRARLRLMNVAIEGVRDGLGGGVLLSTISTLVEDGDPFTQQFARRLLATASAPFTGILVRWVTTGELVDPYNEFFVRESSEPDKLWAKRFRVVRDMIPVHYDRVLTRKIFQVGRSLAFLRGACADSEWVTAQAPQPEPEDTADPRRLEAFVYRAAASVNARLMRVLRENFGLMRHVAAIRRLLMFEQGDFSLSLLEVLDRHIARASRSILAHDLSAALDSAVRSSNAQYEDPDHLSALVLAFANPASAQSDGMEETWENVSLRYVLSAPLTHVVDADTLRKYTDISRFLLRLKRVDFVLNSVWRQQMTDARALQRVAELSRRKDGGSSENPSGTPDKVQRAVRESAIAVSEMIQFFHQVQRYISLNVIEGAWARFVAASQASDIDVDSWNEAHEEYVKAIHGVVCGSASVGFQRNLAAIIDTSLQFVAVVKELNSELMLASRKQSPDLSASSASSPLASAKNLSVSDRLLKLRNGGSRQQQLAQSDEMLAERASRVHAIAARFREQVRDLMRALSHNTASDLQFLVVSIDFNSVYTSKSSA
ncbi:Microtubule-nucleating Tub4p (gamma-tubulin) complex component [Coemansia sp. RSA 1722]|nr:Microtubule-nucleating Tub4p (gamma-tubulin) complex component [Coemansia sp. RSA 485]KAJ2596862.1 Microtubule-nucleating Tub4p (gamma-tubulin) complex component [Coemansia sp. RSA 1722]